MDLKDLHLLLTSESVAYDKDADNVLCGYSQEYLQGKADGLEMAAEWVYEMITEGSHGEDARD